MAHMTRKTILTVGEVLQKVQRAKTKSEKIKLLREFETEPIKALLWLNFCPHVTWDVPKTFEDLKISDAHVGRSDLYLRTQVKMLKYFINNNRPKMPQERKNKKWKNILEGLDPIEQQLLLDVRSQSLKRISKPVVNEAFPGLLDPEW